MAASLSGPWAATACVRFCGHNTKDTGRGGITPQKGRNKMATITKEEAKKAVKEWNAHIESFMKDELPKILEERGVRVKNGKISMNDWFKAAQIVNEQNFYKTGHELQMKLLEAGHDVKMNMQDNTLVFPDWM